MRRVGNSLSRALNNDEVLRCARAQKAMRQWQDVVGEFLAERSHPDRYQKGTVWVAVQGSAWAQELRMRKERILQRLREISGESDLFVEVRFGVRPLPEPEGPPKPEREPEVYQGMTIQEIARRRLASWPGSEDGV